MWKVFLILTGLVLVSASVDIQSETYTNPQTQGLDKTNLNQFKNNLINILNEVEHKYHQFVRNQVPEIQEQVRTLTQSLIGLKQSFIDKLNSLREADLENQFNIIKQKDIHLDNVLNFIKSFDINKINLKNFDFNSVKNYLSDDFLAQFEKILTAKDLVALLMGSNIDRNTIENIKDLVEKYKSKDQSNLFNEYLNDVLNYFESLRESDTLSDYWNNLEQMTMKLIDNLSLNQDTMEQVRESVKSYYQDLKNKFSTKYQETKTNLSEQAEKFTNFIKDKTNLKSYYDDLKDYLETLKDAKDVIKFFKDKKKRLENLNENWSDFFKIKDE